MGVKKSKGVSGIYKITNLVNGKIYVGSSCNIKRRWDEHKYELSHNTHSNGHLQKAYNKYGKNNFSYEIIEECDENDLLKREQYYLDILKPFTHTENGYNIQKIAGGTNKYSKVKNFKFYKSKTFCEDIVEKAENCGNFKGMQLTNDQLEDDDLDLDELYEGYTTFMDLYDEMLLCDPDLE